MNQKNPQQFEIQNIIFLISLPILFLFIGCLYLIVKIITISIIKIIYRNFLIIQIYKKNLVSVWTTAREKKIILICKKNLNMFRNLFKIHQLNLSKIFFEHFRRKSDLRNEPLRKLNEKKKVNIEFINIYSGFTQSVKITRSLPEIRPLYYKFGQKFQLYHLFW